MIKIKKDGFTLSEVLITLTIVGALAMLVLPGLIKDTNNRATMALLQGTISNINSAVQNELLRTRATKIEDTDLYDQQLTFLKTLDCADTKGAGTLIFKPDNGYKNLNGAATTRGSVNVAASAILKNGVGIGISAPDTTNNQSLIAIDLNGKQPPNIIGVDYFEIRLIGKTDEDKGVHFGDIGSYDYWVDSTRANVKTECMGGDPAACYYLAEISGFDPNYIDSDN